jgi:hypothetical protein
MKIEEPAAFPISRDRDVRRGSDTRVMILVLVGFGLVHIIGGVLMQRAATGQSDRPVIVGDRGD